MSAELASGAPPAAVPQPSPAAIDLDAVPSQIGHAVLRASDGTLLRPPTGSLTERDVGIAYRMMLEVGTALEGEGLQRVTVGFGSVSYVMSLGDECMYLVKKRSAP